MGHDPIVQASHLGLLLRAYEALGMSLGPDLEAFGLSVDSASDPEAYVREIPVWAAFGRARRRSGRADFGFFACSQGGIGGLGSFGDALMHQSRSLGDLLTRFCEGVREHNPSPAEFFLRGRGDQVLFCRKSMMISGGAWPIEQYVYSLMVELVRCVAGPHWNPPRAWLQRREALEPAEAAWLPDVRVTLGASATMIEVPSALLALPIREELTDSLRLDRSPAPTADIELAVIRAVLDGLATERHGIDAVAGHLGTTRRTLQRRLAEADTSFRAVRSRARFVRARDLLEHSSVSVGEIALQLGYDDHGSFTRAFRRWAGETPSSYRESLADRRLGPGPITRVGTTEET